MQQFDKACGGEETSPAPEGEENTFPTGEAGSAETPNRRSVRLMSKDDEAKLKTPVARPDAWLERRLRVFERSLEKLESQQKEIQDTQRGALAQIDETVGGINGQLVMLQGEHDRMLPELQTLVKNMRFRLDVVEAVASAALDHADNLHQQRKPEQVEIGDEAAPVFVPDLKAPEKEKEETAPNEAPRQPSYLDLARQHANEAGSAYDENSVARKLEQARHLTRYHKRLLTGIAVGVIVFIASAGLSFQWGYMDGRAFAGESHVTRKSPHKAALTPSRQLASLAEAGDRDAQLLLALKYYPATGSLRNNGLARHWMMRAAKAGHPLAQYLFGKFEERGVAAPPDQAQAIKWYEAAAWSGNRKAMNDLAVIFAQGLGVKSSPEEAALWFYRAADNGLSDAQFNLAILYERGLGVPQSLIHAYKWYNVAAAQGDTAARQRLAVLDAQMNEEDLVVARKLAATFSAKLSDPSANLMPDENIVLNIRQVAAR